MTIEGRSLDQAARQFRDQVNHLLNTTVTRARVRLLEGPRRDLLMLSLQETTGDPGAVLSTDYGRLRLIIGQHLGSEKIGARRHRLKTVKYRYGIALEDGQESLLRWEYASAEEHGDHVWCRHHGHALATLELPEGALSLNGSHVPSGYVPIEDVIRFCIVDFGASTLSPDWHERLTESSRAFKEGL